MTPSQTELQSTRKKSSERPGGGCGLCSLYQTNVPSFRPVFLKREEKLSLLMFVHTLQQHGSTVEVHMLYYQNADYISPNRLIAAVRQEVDGF